MDIQKFALATLAGTITSFITAYLIYGLALHGYMETNIMAGLGKAEPDFMWLIIGHVFLGMVVTYIFMKAGINNLKDGLMVGLTLGILIGLGYNMVNHGTTNMFTGGLATVLLVTVADGIIWAIAGAGVAWALGMGKGD